MKKQNPKTEKVMLGFEVEIEDLGKSTRFPSTLDTNKLNLDVGCGPFPRGDVNVDLFKGGWNYQSGDQVRGRYMDPSKIPNFIVADACHLPFKNGAFEMAYSSHTIEHLRDPEGFIAELCRVSRRKVVLLYPHAQGGGAKMPFHVSFIDEHRVKKAAESLGYDVEQYTTCWDCWISNGIKRFIPHQGLRIAELYSPYRILRAVERRLIRRGLLRMAPLAVEAWIKRPAAGCVDPVVYVVVYNEPETLRKCFLASPHVDKSKVLAFHNRDKKGLPTFFNKIASRHDLKDCWFAFCHQDFFLKEDLSKRLTGKSPNSIYGPIGIFAGSSLKGQITQTNNTLSGEKLADCHPVQTLDEMCIVVHSKLFKAGLRFDERLKFHFYGADFCLQALIRGFDVHALQLDCQHRSKALTGSRENSFWTARAIFAAKWRRHFPIGTTTTQLERDGVLRDNLFGYKVRVPLKKHFDRLDEWDRFFEKNHYKGV
jgi:SAM-dependent methyltransferase